MLNKSLKSQPCGRCGKPTPARVGHPLKFCSEECLKAKRTETMKGNTFRAGLKPTNAFTPGHKTWNLGLKGIHLSPSSEFKAGPRPDRRDPVGTVRIRSHKGVRRAWVKVADPDVWKLRAVVVWVLAHGPLPKGKVVHHRDRNPLNDALENLQALTRAEHAAEHNDELHAAKRHKKSEAIP